MEAPSEQTTIEQAVGAMTPYGDIVSLLSRTLGAANRRLVELMAARGLDGVVPSHGDILIQLLSHETMPMTSLADAIGKDPSTVTALVRKLMGAGYVEKARSPADRRVCEVRLTAAGRALEPLMAAVSAELIATLTADLDAEELRTTYHTLKKMRANAEGRDGIPGKEDHDENDEQDHERLP